jgi:hypothetical protein
VIDGKRLMCTVRKLRPFGDLTEDERLLIEGLELLRDAGIAFETL